MVEIKAVGLVWIGRVGGWVGGWVGETYHIVSLVGVYHHGELLSGEGLGLPSSFQQRSSSLGWVGGWVGG